MKIDYDKIADVLYIAIKDRPGIADEVSSGNFIRYGAGDGEIVGITVLDFKERFIDPPDTGTPDEFCRECGQRLMGKNYDHRQWRGKNHGEM